MHLPDLSLPISDPVLIFALVMVIILVLPLLFQRMRVPGIVGLIIAGVVVGPHALNVLARDQTIELLGTVGLLYIMFIAGLEVDLNEFNRQRNRSVLFGIMTFCLPQGLGTLMGRYLLGFDWASAILLGAVFASHTLLAYPIISRLGLAKEESVTTAVGATILTDTAALLVLAVIVRASEGALTVGFWLQMTVLLGIYVYGVIWGVPKLGRWFFHKVRSDGVVEFVFVLAVVFVSAFIAALVGVEPIIGAFLAGLALNRLVPEHSTLMNRTRFVGESLFIPFFLISVGMLVDVRVLFGGAEAWTVAGAMLGTVVVTKWMAAQGTRALFRYTPDQASMLFGLTIPQAAATLATVLIGYNAGIFGASVLNGTILMMLMTCMIGPWMAERYGRRVALRMQRTPFEASRAPQRILVPLANPQTAPLLMDMALMVYDPKSEQPIFPLAIVRNQEDVQSGVAAGEKLLGHAVVHAAAADVPVNPVVRIDHNVASGILRAVKERMISTVIIGWNGKSSGRHYTFGSILDQMLEESRELVLVSKIEKPIATVERVVMAVPPYAHLEPGFTDVVRTVKVLSGQLSASILVLSSEDAVSEIRQIVNRMTPVVPVTYQPIDTFGRLASFYDGLHDPHDLLLIVAARPGTIAWRPALSRLPRLVAQRYGHVNLVVCYPSVPVEDTFPSHTLPSGDLVLGGLLARERIVLGISGSSSEDVVRDLLAQSLKDEPDLLRETRRAFSPMEADYVPELMPGVALYHAHVPATQDPILLVGLSARGLTIPKSSGPIHVVLALLSPEGGSPEDHLRSLALIARLVRSAETIDRLREAQSRAETRDILAEAFLKPHFGLRRHAALERLQADHPTPVGALYRNVGILVTPHSELTCLFSESLYRTLVFGKRINAIYVGRHSDEREQEVKSALIDAGLSAHTPIVWVEGAGEDALLGAVREMEIDLLLADAFDDPAKLGTELGGTAKALMNPNAPSLLLLAHSIEQTKPYQRIVLVTEYDEKSLQLYRKVLRVAARERADQVFVVHVIPKFGDAKILAGRRGPDVDQISRSLAEEQEMLDDFVQAGGSSSIPVQTFCLEGQLGTAASQFAFRYRADLLVLPSLERYTAVDRVRPSPIQWSLMDAPCDIWIAR